MGRTTLITVVGLALLAAVVIYASVGLSAHKCEVCVAFEGREACRTVEAASLEEARAGATTNACALVASGVTDSMRCQRMGPVRIACDQTR